MAQDMTQLAAPPAADKAAPLALRHTAHDSEIRLGRWRLWVRRDLDLWRRIEQAFGPLDPLEARLRACALTLDELTTLYRIALAKQDQTFSETAIGEMIVRAGLVEASLPLQMLVMALGLGNAKCAELFADPYAEPGDEEPDGIRPPAA